MTAVTFHLPDEAATAAFGASLAPVIRAGDVILLQGPLGAGKTALARGLIRAYSGAAEAPSPTFTLVEIYDGDPAPLWHFDLYRLEQPADVWELGLEEALDSGVSVIEWPDRAGGLLPTEGLRLTLSIEDGGRRLALDAPPTWRTRLNSVGIC